MPKGSFIKDDIVFEMSRDGVFSNSRAWDRKTREALPIDDYKEYYNRAIYEFNLSRYINENNKVIDWHID